MHLNWVPLFKFGRTYDHNSSSYSESHVSLNTHSKELQLDFFSSNETGALNRSRKIISYDEMYEIVLNREIEISAFLGTRLSSAADLLDLNRENIYGWCKKYAFDDESKRRYREKYLFSYGESCDRDKFIVCHSSVYLDPATGILIDAFYRMSDPFSLRSGSCSRTDKNISFDRLHEIIQNNEIRISEKNRFTASDLLKLNPLNWHEWCINHQVISE